MPPAGHTYRLRLAYEFQQRLHCCRARRSPMALEKSAGTSCRRAKLAVSPTAWVSQGFSSSSQASTNIFVLNPPSRTVKLHIWHLTCVGRRVTTVVWVCSSISRLLLPPPPPLPHMEFHRTVSPHPCRTAPSPWPLLHRARGSGGGAGLRAVVRLDLNAESPVNSG
jgi:hypothetical protein